MDHELQKCEDASKKNAYKTIVKTTPPLLPPPPLAPPPSTLITTNDSNNKGKNDDDNDTHFTLLPYFHNFNFMSIARLFWIFSRRLCKSVSQSLGPSVGPSVGQLVGQSLGRSVKSLAFTYLLKRSLSSRSRS